MGEKLKECLPAWLRLWEASPRDFIALLAIGACAYLYKDFKESMQQRAAESRQNVEVLVELTAAIREHNPRLENIERQLDAIRHDKKN